MHVAYSAIQQFSTANNNFNNQNEPDELMHEPMLRYQGYQAACQKLSKEIAAIQQYMPGWMPAFR
jgi:hypothetical protein